MIFNNTNDNQCLYLGINTSRNCQNSPRHWNISIFPSQAVPWRLEGDGSSLGSDGSSEYSIKEQPNVCLPLLTHHRTHKLVSVILLTEVLLKKFNQICFSFFLSLPANRCCVSGVFPSLPLEATLYKVWEWLRPLANPSRTLWYLVI